MKPRTFLGRDQNLAGYRRVYEIEDGLEIDENSFVEIERTRVYFDDVLGITYHVQMGAAFLIAMGLCALFFGGIALIAAFGDAEPAAAIVFACLAAPFVAAFILRLALRVDVITVFGKRTMASMKFGYRKARAREIFRDLTQKIRACQEKAAAAVPKPAPPPAPEVPLPPPAPEVQPPPAAV
jgi:hypothetical protein